MKWHDPYKAGQERICRHFLWLPRTIKGITRWLEYASYKQVSIHKMYRWDGNHGKWQSIELEEYERLVQNNKTAPYAQVKLDQYIYWSDVEWTDLADWSDLENDSILGKLRDKK